MMATPPPLEQMSKNERTWGMLCHLLALAGLLVPFGNVIGPLVIWLIKKDEFAFVNEQGKESLNFQITMAIGFLICIPLALIVIGVILGLALGIFDLVMVIIATIKANEGQHYQYPFRIRFLS